MQARENDLPYETLLLGLEQMEQSLASLNREQIVATLRTLVVEYSPNSPSVSPASTLDFSQ